MTKEEFKKKIEAAISEGDAIAKAAAVDGFQIVSTKLIRGGTDYFYNYRLKAIVMVNKSSGDKYMLKASLEEVPEKLSDMLVDFDCIIKKYKWFGE